MTSSKSMNRLLPSFWYFLSLIQTLWILTISSTLMLSTDGLNSMLFRRMCLRMFKSRSKSCRSMQNLFEHAIPMAAALNLEPLFLMQLLVHTGLSQQHPLQELDVLRDVRLVRALFLKNNALFLPDDLDEIVVGVESEDLLENRIEDELEEDLGDVVRLPELLEIVFRERLNVAQVLPNPSV
mmetsp:Transcript_10400/g.11656  ORF Transcript_10400/g.11656 Transcript_10400/m.11656 type:complete len:182 (-) Transcript_10400:442-987(-)